MYNFQSIFDSSDNFDNIESIFCNPFDTPNFYEQDIYPDKDIYNDDGNNIYTDKDNDNDNDNNNNNNNNNNDENNTFNLHSKDDRSTLVKTKKNLNIKGNNLICWTLDDITNKIFDSETHKNIFSSDIKSKIIKDIQIDEPFLNRKRDLEFTITNDTYGSIDNNNKNQIEEGTSKKRGRKPKNEGGQGKHNKMSSDNIIKKIKGKLFKYCFLFLNNVLSEIKGTKIYELDYKYVNKMKRDSDLKNIGMTLRDLFSGDISPKYGDMPIDTNKINIQALFSNIKDDTLEFIFNMTLRDWIDIFTYKKNISELLSKYNIDNNDIDVKRIEENMIGVHELLKEFAKNNKDEYFSLFTFYLYNYELWFSSRNGRNRKQKK